MEGQGVCRPSSLQDRWATHRGPCGVFPLAAFGGVNLSPPINASRRATAPHAGHEAWLTYVLRTCNAEWGDPCPPPLSTTIAPHTVRTVSAMLELLTAGFYCALGRFGSQPLRMTCDCTYYISRYSHGRGNDLRRLSLGKAHGSVWKTPISFQPYLNV